MGRTLLVGRSGASWYEWLRENRKARDLIVLDPSDAHYGPGARLWMIRGDRPLYSCFYGSLDPGRAPHMMAAALSDFLQRANADAIVQLFSYRPSPLHRQTAHMVASMVQPETLLIETGTEIDGDGWPIGPEYLELPVGLPPMVVAAQRKAQWLKLIERGNAHEVMLHSLCIQGARLGSGTPLDEHARVRVGLAEALYAEVCGSALLIVGGGGLSESTISRALDLTHTKRTFLVEADEYSNLLCSFVRQNGEEFGFGMIERIDFELGVLHVRSDAIPPVPVHIMRLGSLKVDRDGRELGEVRPWQV